MSLSVVIATQGRVMLPEVLKALQPENQSGFKAEIIVVADTHGQLGMDIIRLKDHFNFRYVELDAGTHAMGNPQIQFGYNIASEEFIMNCGDDDIVFPDILPEIDEIVSQRTVPYLFQAILHPSPTRGNNRPVILWNPNEKEIKRQKLTGQNLISPNVQQKLGFWWDDFCHIEATINRWSGEVEWIPKIIMNCY